MKTLQITVNVSEPELITENVYKTTLTHPIFSGELVLLHSLENRENILNGQNDSLRKAIDDVVEVSKNLGGTIETALSGLRRLTGNKSGKLD